MSNKNYRGLRQLQSFEDRFEYLSIRGRVADPTFGNERHLNQAFYTSREWRRVRHDVLVRDNGCDLGVEGYEIFESPIIHHIEPLTIEDIVEGRDSLFSMDNLITVSHNTHNAIHYGDRSKLLLVPKERTPGDTTLWR